MRVAGGQLGGRPLVAPRGGDTRPTLQRVRGALFDALEARTGGLAGGRALDLFAGSGALGIEALSRGCAEACFVEREPAALRALRRNVEALGLSARARIRAADVWQFLAGSGWDPAGYRLVVADPPYADGACALLVALGSAGGWADGALCAFEHGAWEELPARSGTLLRLWHRAYGDTAVSVFGPRPSA